MSVTYRTFIRLFLVISVVLASVSINQTAHADAPSIVVTAVWRPGTQLSSIDKGTAGQRDPGDDLRYVDLELNVTTTNVQFWAMELTCTVNKAALELPDVTFGEAWSSVDAYQLIQPFNPATGAMTIAIANPLEAPFPPFDKVAQTLTLRLLTIRYQVKPVAAAMTSPASCTGSFLDQDGKPVLAPTFIVPPTLTIVPGYSISGNVSYQSRTAKSGISVSCTGPGGNIPAVTDISGNFAVKTRDQGKYTCKYGANTSSHAPFAPDLYLQSSTTVLLGQLSFKMLPAILPGGNLDRSNTTIDFSDLALVTSNYGNLVAGGDINGDGKTDKSDLAIISGNFNQSELHPISHVLYGMIRGPFESGSHIWTSTVGFNRLTQLVPGTNVDNWPAISPDGSKIVFTRMVGTFSQGVPRFALFIMNSDGTGTATQLTQITGPNGNYDAFAASWSPDGSHIAFNCSAFPDYLRDDSSLCMIDASGHGFKVLDRHVHIYPPAWVSSDILIYSGNSNHDPSCTSNGKLCSINLTLLENVPLSIISSGNFGALDMPSVSDDALFFRELNGNSSSFRMVNINSVGNSTDTPVTILSFPDADFYSVKPGSRDIILSSSKTSQHTAEIQTSPSQWIPINPDPVPVSDEFVFNNTSEAQSFFYVLRTTTVWVP